MSQENVEIVRRAIEASVRGDFERALASVRPDRVVSIWRRVGVMGLSAVARGGR